MIPGIKINNIVGAYLVKSDMECWILAMHPTIYRYNNVINTKQNNCFFPLFLPLKKQCHKPLIQTHHSHSQSLCIGCSITPGFHSLSFSCSLLHRKFLGKYKSIVLWWVSIWLAVGFQRYSAPNFILLFLTLEKNALIFNHQCVCVKYMLPKVYCCTSGFTKKEARSSWDCGGHT